MPSEQPHLILVSKSTWRPAIRREHALAIEAANDDVRVTFIERPTDVRALLEGGERVKWLRNVSGLGRPWTPLPNIEVVPRSTVVPAHRSGLGQITDQLFLRFLLRRLSGVERATLVAMVPWDWPAVARSQAARHVLDYTDDWEALVPERERAVRRLISQAEREADSIVVVSEHLGERFTGRSVSLVRNGVSSAVLNPRPTLQPNTTRAAYLGTLSDRFDVPLLRDSLRHLPREWTVDLYGPCQYPHLGDRPSYELTGLLEDTRVIWHGPIERDAVAPALDDAAVLLVPHRRFKPGTTGAQPSWRGDVMKLYDYSARARPIVSTNYVDDLKHGGPPVLHLADGGASFARAILQAAHSAPESLIAQRAWASEQQWSSRWRAWKGATGLETS